MHKVMAISGATSRLVRVPEFQLEHDALCVADSLKYQPQNTDQAAAYQKISGLLSGRHLWGGQSRFASEQINAWQTPTGVSSANIVYLQGPDGVGKSRLARHFVRGGLAQSRSRISSSILNFSNTFDLNALDESGSLIRCLENNLNVLQTGFKDKVHYDWHLRLSREGVLKGIGAESFNLPRLVDKRALKLLQPVLNWLQTYDHTLTTLQDQLVEAQLGKGENNVPFQIARNFAAWPFVFDVSLKFVPNFEEGKQEVRVDVRVKLCTFDYQIPKTPLSNLKDFYGTEDLVSALWVDASQDLNKDLLEAAAERVISSAATMCGVTYPLLQHSPIIVFDDLRLPSATENSIAAAHKWLATIKALDVVTHKVTTNGYPAMLLITSALSLKRFKQLIPNDEFAGLLGRLDRLVTPVAMGDLSSVKVK